MAMYYLETIVNHLLDQSLDMIMQHGVHNRTSLSCETQKWQKRRENTFYPYKSIYCFYPTNHLRSISWWQHRDRSCGALFPIEDN